MQESEGNSIVHMRLELQQEQNAKAIHELTEAVKSLAHSMEREDKELKHAVEELIKVQTECKFRYESIQQRVEVKKLALEETKKKLSTKANKEDLESLKNFIHKALWWLFAGMAGTIGFMLKFTLFKEG